MWHPSCKYWSVFISERERIMGYTTKILDLQFAMETSDRVANYEQQEIDCEEYDFDVDPVNAEYYSRYCSII